MRVLTLERTPFHVVEYQEAGPGRTGSVRASLPFLRGRASILPSGIEALVVASDLQGRVGTMSNDSPPPLLAIALINELRELALLGELPALEKVGVVLAGDLWARPELDRRSGSGDLLPVCRAYTQAVGLTMVIPGNHDLIAHPQAFRTLLEDEQFWWLHEEHHDSSAGLFGGLGGVVGNTRRPFRHTATHAEASVLERLARGVDVLVLHEGPHVSERQPGYKDLSDVLALAEKPIQVICGHSHWEQPVAILPDNPLVSVLNVDKRVVVLEV